MQRFEDSYTGPAAAPIRGVGPEFVPDEQRARHAAYRPYQGERKRDPSKIEQGQSCLRRVGYIPETPVSARRPAGATGN
jgi:hypothetical protein